MLNKEWVALLNNQINKKGYPAYTSALLIIWRRQ